MRILICDDDDLIINQLQKYLSDFFDQASLKCPEIVTFSDGESLLSDTGEKDILFLDIEMPGMNGIYVGKELKKRNKNIIIFVVTSYAEYLDEAMRFHVFRYLSKPLEKQRLFRNLRDALHFYNTTTIKLSIETKQDVYTVRTSDIIFIEADGHKIIVHTKENDYISIHNLQYWLHILPKNCFFQIHRSFIVNLEHVTNFDHATVHLYNNQFTAYLARRNHSSFKEAYLLYLESTR
ncbi:MAG: response regulator transcription factor [Lachnospiraceae bacterium]|nr:response regulator transcription factor [Lachnospiraceae bacterium]